MERQFKIFSARASIKIATHICKHLDVKLGNNTIIEFSDGEIEPSYDESIRGADIFIVQSTMPPADNLMELLLMIDAARRASAYKINVVIPYFGYARQDKKGKPRVPIGAKLIANLLSSAGVDRILTMDLHADQIQGFFDFPVDHLYSSTLFIPYIQSLNLPNLTIASPDMGGSNRANTYARFLNAEVVICYKHREKPNEIGKMLAIGDVANRDIVLVDDMIDTAGTLTKAADLMLSMGANSVRAVCTHAVFSGEAYKRIENSALIEIAVTDTIPKNHVGKKIKEISVSEIFASSIKAVLEHRSISEYFIQ